MRVPGVVFASKALLPEVIDDRSMEQVANVATLPGIVVASYAMPDVHWGYGFPIGGVAATSVDQGGVVSPGGVGFDISCGVRLLTSDLCRDDLSGCLPGLMDALAARIPRGMGRGAVWPLDSERELAQVLRGGARWAVEHGIGTQRDLDRCEDYGAVSDAEPAQVSQRARQRGLGQLGSLGSGNHFLEVQVVETIHDPVVAATFGLQAGQVTVMIHCGSRGLGHQVCSDHVQAMLATMGNYQIQVPDRQLACAPVNSPQGRAYLAAMAAAANYGRANRHLLAQASRDAFATATGRGRLELVYDVSHNLAKLETHQLHGQPRLLCVHRKGATRALPPGHPDLPADLQATGQPVLVPGSMGTASWVLAGMPGGAAFWSACHGAGRRLSRHQALRQTHPSQLRADLARAGVQVRADSNRGLAEETPLAYKDVDQVVATCEQAGLARRVARLRPVGVIKG
jgi:tRNA-splicing ligase RtcB (3'-phosphate/5'-hydroxy nucleic acid ligase)